MPSARYCLCVFVLGTHIYCIGGYNGQGGYLSVVERYDTESGDWSTLAPMPTARQGAAAFVLEGKIYVSGGDVDSVNYTDVVERYDPVSGAWDTVSSLPGQRAYGAGCSVRSEVNYFDSLLSGGRD